MQTVQINLPTGESLQGVVIPDVISNAMAEALCAIRQGGDELTKSLGGPGMQSLFRFGYDKDLVRMVQRGYLEAGDGIALMKGWGSELQDRFIGSQWMTLKSGSHVLVYDTDGGLYVVSGPKQLVGSRMEHNQETKKVFDKLKTDAATRDQQNENQSIDGVHERHPNSAEDIAIRIETAKSEARRIESELERAAMFQTKHEAEASWFAMIRFASAKFDADTRMRFGGSDQTSDAYGDSITLLERAGIKMDIDVAIQVMKSTKMAKIARKIISQANKENRATDADSAIIHHSVGATVPELTKIANEQNVNHVDQSKLMGLTADQRNGASDQINQCLIEGALGVFNAVVESVLEESPIAQKTAETLGIDGVARVVGSNIKNKGLGKSVVGALKRSHLAHMRSIANTLEHVQNIHQEIVHNQKMAESGLVPKQSITLYNMGLRIGAVKALCNVAGAMQASAALLGQLESNPNLTQKAVQFIKSKIGMVGIREADQSMRHTLALALQGLENAKRAAEPHVKMIGEKHDGLSAKLKDFKEKTLKDYDAENETPTTSRAVKAYQRAKRRLDGLAQDRQMMDEVVQLAYGLGTENQS